MVCLVTKVVTLKIGLPWRQNFPTIWCSWQTRANLSSSSSLFLNSLIYSWSCAYFICCCWLYYALTWLILSVLEFKCIVISRCLFVDVRWRKCNDVLCKSKQSKEMGESSLVNVSLCQLPKHVISSLLSRKFLKFIICFQS